MSKIITSQWSRRGVLKAGAVTGAALGAPMFFTKNAFAADFLNDPGSAANVTFGFNVPQTGAYADEGGDELRAYQLAVKHINGEGDGGMMNTMKPLSLSGSGVLGKKVTYVTGDTQTKSDAARASAKRMIEKRRRDYGYGRLFFGRGDCNPVTVPGSGCYLHGGFDPFKRYHR